MKYFRIWFFVCAISIWGKAEVHAQTAFTEVTPSVNAQQFITAASMSNGLQTGQISVNIPLFNLQGKGVDVPISISFNGGGITHQTEASSIGLGWSLLAGGVITQNIRDMNDLGYNERRPWHYNASYLQNKQSEQNNNPYTSNLFELAMQHVNMDKEPDIFNYSFLGYSGDICLEYNADGSRTWTMYPDKSFRLEKTTEGIKIVANDGVEYLFEETDQKISGSTISITSWFLTKIKTLKGGTFTFYYEDDCSYDLSLPKDPNYATDRSKRLTRIDYDFGYVTFVPAGRGDKSYTDATKVSRRITNIESYNKEGVLIKGFQLDNNDYIYNNNSESFWQHRRLKLNGIREYDQNRNYLPYHKFEYDHHFDLPKTSIRPGDLYPLTRTKNTWAHHPGIVASVDRDHYGWLKPRRVCSGYTPDGTCMWALEGFYTQEDIMDGYSLSDYLCLTKIEYPTGGSESYYYENHDYGLYSNSQENLPAFTNQKISGKRLWKKEISDGEGNIQTVLYKYRLHNQNNQLTSTSSGVLINPSVHTSTMYSPGGDENGRWLEAIPFQTLSPQNSPSGSSVYYTEIEETQTTASGSINGKKIYYFERMYFTPAANYIYLNYSIYNDSRDNLLINLPNTIYGKQNYYLPELEGLSTQNFTYLAYPVGRFNISHLREGKLVKEVTLNANGEIIRKMENEYTAGDGIEKTLFGLVVKEFNDGDSGTPGNTGDDKKRYLIAQTQLPFGIRELVKRTITHFYQNDSIFENQSFLYTNLNLLQSSSTTSSIGKLLVKEHVYPNEIVFQTSSNLSGQATSIKRMKDLNMIGIPVQTTVKNGNEYTEGTYNTFKQLTNGAIGIDTVFSLGTQAGTSVAKPFVKTNGLVIRSANFILDKAFLSYDSNGNPTTVVGKDGVKETIVWGYGGQYPIARIVNYTDNQLQNNSVVLNQLALLDNFTTISASDRSNLSNCNQMIKNNLPFDAMVSTFTYSPLIGMTSATDQTGMTTYYEYDSFGRLKNVLDHYGKIIEHYNYQYKQ